MKRVAILLAIVIVILLALLIMGLGWNAYITGKIGKIAGQKPEEAASPGYIPQPQAQKSEEPAKTVMLKIGERAGYKRNGYAEINVTVTNLENFSGEAQVFAELYYSRKPIANSTVLISLQPNQKLTQTIRIDTAESWNAFDVRQI